MAQSGRASTGSTTGIWGVLTLVVLGLTVLAVIYFTVILIDPSLSPLGGDSEPTLVALLSTATPRPTVLTTPTLAAPADTWTPEPTMTPEPTATTRPARATRTPRPTVFFTPIPSSTPTPEPTVHPWPFKLVDEGVVFTRYPFMSECNWLGIAGEVLDQEGEPIIGIAVVLNGGGFQNHVTYSGQAPDYAPSGWEHFLDSNVKEGDFLIQLWHQGRPVSEQVDVRTRRDCRANLAYLVFEVAWEDYVVP